MSCNSGSVQSRSAVCVNSVVFICLSRQHEIFVIALLESTGTDTQPSHHQSSAKHLARIFRPVAQTPQSISNMCKHICDGRSRVVCCMSTNKWRKKSSSDSLDRVRSSSVEVTTEPAVMYQLCEAEHSHTGALS